MDVMESLNRSLTEVEVDPESARARWVGVPLMFTLEFALALICYMLSYFHLAWIAWFICAVMLGYSGRMQLRLARGLPMWEQYAEEDLEFFCGVPVSCLHIKTWVYDLIKLSPNTLNIMLSATAVGGSWCTWPEHQEAFEKRWQVLPLIGYWIGSAGIPLLLTICLALNFMGRLILLLVFSRVPGARFEVSNLTFLENMHNDGNPEFRFLILPVGRLPLLWFKVSLMGLTNTSMSWKQQVSVTSAILLGWNGLVPIVWPSLQKFPKPDKGTIFYAMIAAALVNMFILIVIAIHCVGIMVCDSHDFSAFHMECTQT